MPLTAPALTALEALNNLSKKHALKVMRKYAEGTSDAWFLETLIVQLEATKEQIGPEFLSKTP